MPLVLDLQNNKPVSGENKPLGAISIKQAIEIADRVQRSGLLGQQEYQQIVAELDPSDRYAFNMALIDNAIKVRTSSVNVVDREEPMAGGLGDASVSTPNLWTDPMPRDDLNVNPEGTMELEHEKPRRSEGQAPLGHSLTELTVEGCLRLAQGYGEGELAVPLERFLELLNEGVGLEYSQSIRYSAYADTLLMAFRDALAGELDSHAEEEIEHAKLLSAHLVALGGDLSPKVDPIVSFASDDPEIVQKILHELWVREQDGLDFYKELHKSCGDNVFVHTIEDILVLEQEHVDDLMRFGHVIASAFVPGPKAPFRSTPAMWANSYHDENAFEGLDKMGEGELGECPHCAPMSKRRPVTVVRRAVYGEVPVHIECEAGYRRRRDDGSWFDTPQQAAYGFIPGSRGADGEPVDVYLGEHPSRDAYVVSQMKPGNGRFDEEKIMLGFSSKAVAEAAYRSHFPRDGKDHFGGIRKIGLEELADTYMKADSPDPYVPRWKLRLERTGQLVPNPNPRGRVKMVTKEYADQWRQKHGPSGPPKPFGAPPDPKPSRPAPKVEEPVDKPLRSVDTSRAKSPVEKTREPDKVEQMYKQFWQLLGGPGFDPNRISVRDVYRCAKQAQMLPMSDSNEQYSSPDSGPLGTDGEPTHPEEDEVVAFS